MGLYKIKICLVLLAISHTPLRGSESEACQRLQLLFTEEVLDCLMSDTYSSRFACGVTIAHKHFSEIRNECHSNLLRVQQITSKVESSLYPESPKMVSFLFDHLIFSLRGLWGGIEQKGVICNLFAERHQGIVDNCLAQKTYKDRQACILLENNASDNAILFVAGCQQNFLRLALESYLLKEQSLYPTQDWAMAWVLRHANNVKRSPLISSPQTCDVFTRDTLAGCLSRSLGQSESKACLSRFYQEVLYREEVLRQDCHNLKLLTDEILREDQKVRDKFFSYIASTDYERHKLCVRHAEEQFDLCAGFPTTKERFECLLKSKGVTAILGNEACSDIWSSEMKHRFDSESKIFPCQVSAIALIFRLRKYFDHDIGKTTNFKDWENFLRILDGPEYKQACEGMHDYQNGLRRKCLKEGPAGAALCWAPLLQLRMRLEELLLKSLQAIPANAFRHGAGSFLKE